MNFIELVEQEETQLYMLTESLDRITAGAIKYIADNNITKVEFDLYTDAKEVQGVLVIHDNKQTTFIELYQDKVREIKTLKNKKSAMEEISKLKDRNLHLVSNKNKVVDYIKRNMRRISAVATSASAMVQIGLLVYLFMTSITGLDFVIPDGFKMPLYTSFAVSSYTLLKKSWDSISKDKALTKLHKAKKSLNA